MELEPSSWRGMRAIYKKTETGFSLKKDESTLKINTISIQQQPPSYGLFLFYSGHTSTSALYLYPTEVTRTRCSLKDEVFVLIIAFIRSSFQL